MLAKTLIQEASCSGCGATIKTVGTAELKIHTVLLGNRLTPHRCGPSREVVRDTERVLFTVLGGKEYVVELLDDPKFTGEKQAVEDGCVYIVTVEDTDRIRFDSRPPADVVALIEDYR